MFTAMQFGGGNLIRLGSNLILTRLLFPEAFGLMALVQVFLTGLNMFSDLGIGTSIVQNPRGDDPNFLNTAWTLQIFRGVLLWLGACALAPVAASIYGEPMLLQLLPIMGLSLIIRGFSTTNVYTGQRHLSIGRQAVIQLALQIVTAILTILMALWLQSIWALVYSTLIAAAIQVYLFHRLLPGIKNRFYLERDSIGQIFHFGKFIFFSTVAGFLVNQGDKAVLGVYVPIDVLGIYNVALVLGTLPVLLSQAVASKIMLPLFRMRPPQESPANRAKIFKTRRVLVIAFMAITIVMSYGGDFLMDLLYDERYALAGPMVVLFGFASVPVIAFSYYDQVLLAAGESKKFFYLICFTAIIQTTLLFTGINLFGIVGAILAPCISALISYPLRKHMLRPYHANDDLGDAAFLTVGFLLSGIACWLHWDDILLLLA